MATHLDLEEQEQLEALKHFWNRWGNLITWVLIAVLAAYAAWNGWQYWQRRQGEQAGALYEALRSAAEAGDTARVEQALADLQKGYAGTAFADQGALLAARALDDKAKPDAAKAALQWVVDKSGDAGLRATARLRLAGVQVEQKAFDDALKTLSADAPIDFQALLADRKGDVLKLQGKSAEAIEEYRKAWRLLGEQGGAYRQLVEVKLAALGADALGNAGLAPGASAAAAAGSAAVAPPAAASAPASPATPASAGASS